MKTKITDYKFYPASKKAKKYGIIANCNITLNEEFAVTNITLREGEKGTFVSFPSLKGKDDTYFDVFFPITKKARKDITDFILEAWEDYDEDEDEAPKKKKSKKSKKAKDEDEDEDEDDDLPFGR